MIDTSPHRPTDKPFDSDTCFIIQKYLVAFGCILISLTIGSVYSFGNIQPYLSSYIAYSNRNGNVDLHATYSDYQYQTNTIYCLLIIFQSVSMSFGSKIYLIFGFQRSCLLGCFIVSFGIGLTYFTCNNLFLSCLTFGIMFGIGSGIVYPTLILCCMAWWPHKRTLMAAIISCSYGLGATIFNIVESCFINPNNIKQDKQFGYMQQEDLMYNFPGVFVLLALVFSLLQIIGILCLRNPTALYAKYYSTTTPYYQFIKHADANNATISPYILGGKGITMNDDHDIYSSQYTALKDNDNDNDDYTVQECFYLREFWKLFVIAMLNITICMFVVALYQDFSFNYLGINNALYLSIIGSVSSMFHAFFRLTYSHLYDFYFLSFQKANATTSIIFTCFVATLSLCKYSATVMIFMWQIVLFSCLGSIYTFIPKCVAKNFGITNCIQISSMILLSEIPASIIFATICSNMNNSINAYNNILIILCIFGIISVMLTLNFSPSKITKKKKKKKKNNLHIAQNSYIPTENEENTSKKKYPELTIEESITDIIARYESLIPPYLTVIGGMLLMITIGSSFCFGNIKPYIASYLASVACNDCSDSEMKDLYSEYSHRTNWIFCSAVIFEAIASVIGGKLELYLGAEYCALLGSAILSLGVAVTHFSINHIGFCVLTYGILFGFGAGIAYPGVIVCVMRWWPNHIGVATGFIYAGFGFGAFIFDVIETLYVNPNNIRDDADIGFLKDVDVLERVPQMFLFIASVFMTMQILGVLLMSSNIDITSYIWYNNVAGKRETRNTSSMRYVNIESNNNNSNTSADNIFVYQQQNVQDYNVYKASEAFFTYKFWQLFVISVLNIIVFLFITTEWKLFMNDYLKIDDDYFASFVGSISAFCNGLFRIIWGLYYDWNKSFSISMGTMTIGLTICTGTLSFCSLNPKIMIIWWYAILFSCIGGSYSFYPKVVSNTFGYTYSGIIIGCLLLAQIPAAIAFLFISNSIHNEKTTSWRDITIVMSILSFLSAILAITYKTPDNDNCVNKELTANQRQTRVNSYENDYLYQFMPQSGHTQSDNMTSTSPHNAEEKAFGDFDENESFHFNFGTDYNDYNASIPMDNETLCSDTCTHSIISNLSDKK